MRKLVGLAGGTLALALMASMSSRADNMYPNSFVNIHANASSLGVSNDYNNGNCCYNNYNSSSADGGGGGAAVRFVFTGHLMFDASYNTDNANVSDGSVRINQGTAGLGYLGNFYGYGTWYAEVMYTTFRPNITSNFFCGGSCGTINYNGAGVKGGFMWPFAGQWYATADFGLAGLSGPSGTNSLVQGIIGGSVGYKFNPNIGMSLGILANAWDNGNSNNNYNYNNGSTISVTSLQLGFSVNF
jgi:hypothetical protein